MNREALNFNRPSRLQATTPPERRGISRDQVRLLVSSDRGDEHVRFDDLPKFLPRGSLLVVNDSATLPASLPAWHSQIGPIMVNVSTHYGGGIFLVEPRWSASRPGPLPVNPGDTLAIDGVHLSLLALHPGLPRLWFVRAEGAVDAAMRRVGVPVRYGYIEPPYPGLGEYQTLFARVPGSAEMPSAARPFTPDVVEALRAKGINFASVTLHAGVSSHEVETDEVEHQPLYAEPFVVRRGTAEAVTATRSQGSPVIAVGTTVVRALESAWNGSRVRPASGFTRLLVHPGRPVRSVDGLLTGLHDPLASHLALLLAIAPDEVVRSAYAEAVREQYLWHEFGDSHLLFASRA